MYPSALKKIKVSALLAVMITMTTLVSGVSLGSIANASTTDQSSIDALAQLLVTDSVKVHDDGLAQTLAQPVLSVLSSGSFDWNEVMFGTDAVSSSQTHVAEVLTTTLQQLSTFDLLTTSAASPVITNAVTELQALNPSVQESDAIAFISAMVNNGPNTMLSLVTQTSTQYAQTLHSAFASELNGASSAIQAVFTSAGPSTTPVVTTPTTAPVTTIPGSTTTATTPQATSSFQNTLTTQNVSTGGGQLTATDGNSQIQLAIAANAFSQAELVSVTGADVSLVSSVIPSGLSAIAAVGVTFSGSAPTQAMTLTIQNTGITPASKVFKLNQGTLTPVQATVTNGQAVISFSTDPDFIVATPSAPATGSTATTTTTGTTSGTVTTTTKVPVLGKNQRAILINGKAIIVPVVVKNNTTYMPIWYVGEVLKELGDQYRWDGHNWHITTPKTVKPNFSQRKPGHGTMSIYLNNVLVQHVTGLYAKDPGSGKLTTYMPIWYVMQVLKRVNIPTTWNGKDWGFLGSNKS